MNILLIEDNNLLRNLYAKFLQMEEYNVKDVVMLVEAQQAISQGSFDVIISDLGLHDATVVQVLDFLAIQQANSRIIVISGDAKHRSLVADYGFCFYVKPVRQVVLLETITHPCQQDMTSS